MRELDHVIVAVESLRRATRAFESAGFTVLPGGRHDALPTENALVPFADGTYLELLAARDPAARAEWRTLAAGPGWARHLHGVSAIARRFLPSLAGDDGVVDWCLGSAELSRVTARLRQHGHVAAGPVAMSRERADGEKLAWSLLLPVPRWLPFWIADRTPRGRRVPGMSGPHANGASGIAKVHVLAASVPMTSLALGDVLGVIPEVGSDGAATLDLGAWRVGVTAGEPERACAVSVKGCAALSAELLALGVLPEA